MLDYVIVGQGLAGSLIGFLLLKKGKKIGIVDNNFSTSSSMAAAGIINPITGRHFVKSWKTDELYPVFTQTYLEISELIQKKIFHPKKRSPCFQLSPRQSEISSRTNSLGSSLPFSPLLPISRPPSSPRLPQPSREFVHPSSNPSH
jgi:glycine/D-amino acid oxidase-like deaminating enzyme